MITGAFEFPGAVRANCIPATRKKESIRNDQYGTNMTLPATEIAATRLLEINKRALSERDTAAVGMRASL